MSYEAAAKSYETAVAASVGIPEFWQEDCAQEIQLAYYLSPDVARPVIARRTAIDFVRWLYGRRYRRRYLPLLDQPAPTDSYGVVDAMLDAKRAIARLTSTQRRIIEHIANGETVTVSHSRVSQIRRLLRDEVART